MKNFIFSQKELVNLDPVIAKLNGVIEMTAERSGKTSALLLEKRDEMMNMYLDAQVLARDKLNELHARLKQVREYHLVRLNHSIHKFAKITSSFL